VIEDTAAKSIDRAICFARRAEMAVVKAGGL
jgi:hypothetical protein